ncbi:hypothetical protein HNQ07_003614 [Deinococcus metalli]|uniref:Uncharacterized protein n=1 Tax=Deinococcus metalli TaxID=1141878 RepID=A0A7W8KJ46_9DEIO|nr:DUF6624 domain-containing protein [Deinococcus metalli]MBB5378113.1 hypothetical protein [Deinococcus metalli]GHF54546.1 hypothetical protein GCM10017781_33580 [Deinococcus metalli]
MTALLAGLGVATAQTEPLPDAAGCAKVMAPNATPMTPAFTAAVRSTTHTYVSRLEFLVAPFRTRPATPAQFQPIRQVAAEAEHYVTRLLKVTGWPTDPGLREDISRLLIHPPFQWCVGQVALSAATTPAERSQAAGLIDQALVAAGENQRYGTALTRRGSRLVPLPIADEPDVDARRAAAGLPPLKEILAALQATVPPRLAPAGLKRPVVLHEVCRRFTGETALNIPLTPGQIDALAERAAELVEQDQASRTGHSGARSMQVVDRESTIWLKEVLRQRGWPSANRSDPQLAFNAWLLTQHADARPAVQACVLDLMTQQVSTPDEERNLAYLTDRVRLASGQPQVYGTQVSYDDVQGKATPRLLEDPARVNERRAKVGLEPIEEYLKGFERPRP